MSHARIVAVVGGGAAGLMAAVVAAERGCDVTIYEASDRVGRSILASGNGRCNFSNSMLDVRRYHNAEFAEAALRALDEAVCFCGGAEAMGQNVDEGGGRAAATPSRVSAPHDPGSRCGFAKSGLLTRPVHDFFARHGLVWAEEGQGRLYPASRKATSVLDVLRYAAAAAGAKSCCSMPIALIEPPRAAGKPFTLRTREGEFKRADAVIVAVGGKIAGGILPDLVPFVQTRPMLGPLATNTEVVRTLDNTRARVAIHLIDAQGAEKACEYGEVLFRKYGVSGIAVFNLSRLAEPGDTLSISLLPVLGHGFGENGHDGEEPGNGLSGNEAEDGSVSSSESGHREVCKVEAFLRERFDYLAAVYRPLNAEAFFRGLFTGVLAEAVCKQAGVEYEDPLSSADLQLLACAIANFSLTVKGIGDVKQCQVHRGGIAVYAVEPKTMQVRDIPGLYVVGEALDIDGPCGGYNLHWAWTSGMLAGVSC